MEPLLDHAADCIHRCRALALHTEEPGFTTRTFLSPPMHQVHYNLRQWMVEAGMTVTVDAAGNLRGCYAAADPDAPVLFWPSVVGVIPCSCMYRVILAAKNCVVII